MNKLLLKKSPVHPISILQVEVRMFSWVCSAASFPSSIPGIGRIMSSPVQQRADLPLLSKCFSLLLLLPEHSPTASPWVAQNRRGGQLYPQRPGTWKTNTRHPGTINLAVWNYWLLASSAVSPSIPPSLCLFTYQPCRDRRKIEVEESLCFNVFCVKGKQAAPQSM